MMNIDDEMLNRFLDNELNPEEEEFVKKSLTDSPDLKKRYESLLKAHTLLKSLTEDSPSMDFTKLLMNKLNSGSAILKQQKYFLFSALSILGLIIFVIVGYLVYQIISAAQVTESKEIVINYSKTLGDYLSGLFSKNSLSIIGSVLSLIMIVSGYFLFEFQRQSKKKFIH